MKNVQRINESQLRAIVAESVKYVLNELNWKTYANAAKKASLKGRSSRALKFRDAAINAFNDEYGYKDDNRSLEAMSAYDDDWNSWRVQDDEGNPLSPINAFTPHMSLHYSYDNGNGYKEYGKTSSDLGNDGERSIRGTYDVSDPANNGFGMISSPSMNFPSGGYEEYEPKKWRGRNDRGFNEFDNYRKGKYDYNKEEGWHLKDK